MGQKLVSQVKVAMGVGWGLEPLLLRKEGLLLEARELGAGERWVWPHGRHSDPSS